MAKVSIEKRPRKDGTTAHRVIWWPHGTTAKRESLTLDDPREAETLRRLLELNNHDLQAATRLMQEIRAKVPTVADTVEQHISLLTGIQERTRKDYRSLAARHINPHLGALPITAPDRDRIRIWINDLAATGMSPKTLRNAHALLSAVYTWVNQEHPQWRGDNPAKGLRLPVYHPAEMTYLTPAELDIVLNHLPSFERDIVMFLAGTGCRWGELIALQVGDFHLDHPHPYVAISKAVKRTPGGHYVGDPKSLASRRWVSLPETLITIVRRLIAGIEQRLGTSDLLDAYVFAGPKGGRLHHTNFYMRKWRPAVDAARATHDKHGYPIPTDQRISKNPRIHDLRHTHASWLIADGVDLPTVQRRLGHESITTTVDRYGHLSPEQLQRGARAADLALRRVLMTSPRLDPTPIEDPDPDSPPPGDPEPFHPPQLRLVHTRTDPAGAVHHLPPRRGAKRR